MSHIIDRRIDSGGKSTVNRQKFIKRFKTQIKRAVNESMGGRSITNADSCGDSVNIPIRDLSEPTFGHGKGGIRDTIYPGNREFLPGDLIIRPQGDGGGGGGSGAAADGEGEDDFAFELSRDEFLDLFFDDLELPNLIRNQLAATEEYKTVRSGFTSEGTPGSLSVIRSLRGSLSRRIAMTSGKHRRIKEIEEEIEYLLSIDPIDEIRITDLQTEAESLRIRARAVPFLDTFDLRYSNHTRIPQPVCQAVVFFILDVSGSMDQNRKDLAKRFFILLYLFLKRNYKKIEVVFIRHHTVAKEVNEDEFFNSRETGGTVVSSALDLMHKIATERYPLSQWNLYVAQASDGDNWEHDCSVCETILETKILSMVRYFAYIEITPENHQNLWDSYWKIKQSHSNFAMSQVDESKDIFPVFRKLFERRSEIRT